MLVWRIGERIAARAGGLDSCEQCRAIAGFVRAHQRAQSCGQIGQARRLWRAQAPLGHRRHKAGRAGPWIGEMRHTKMPRERDIRAVAGAFASAQLERVARQSYQQRHDMDVAGIGVVMSPGFPRQFLAGEPKGLPEHPDRPPPASPAQAASPWQGQGHGQNLGRPTRSAAQPVKQRKGCRFAQDRNSRPNRGGRALDTGLCAAGIAQGRKGGWVRAQERPHCSTLRVRVLRQAHQDQKLQQIPDVVEALHKVLRMNELLQRQQRIIHGQTERTRLGRVIGARRLCEPQSHEIGFLPNARCAHRSTRMHEIGTVKPSFEAFPLAALYCVSCSHRTLPDRGSMALAKGYAHAVKNPNAGRLRAEISFCGIHLSS